jgi:hypothetical protein
MILNPFDGISSIDNENSWWAIGSIQQGDRVTKDAIDSLKLFLQNKKPNEQILNKSSKIIEMIVAIDIVYHRPADHKRYEWSGIAQLFEDARTGDPFLVPIATTPFYRNLLRTITAPIYRMGPTDSGMSQVKTEQVRPTPMPSLLSLFMTDFKGKGKGSGGGVVLAIDGYSDLTRKDATFRFFYQVIEDFGSNSKFISFYIPSSPYAYEAIEYLVTGYKLYINPPLQADSGGSYTPAITKSEDLVFTSRIFLYCEDTFTLPQLGKLAERYEQEKLKPEFRTTSYALAVWDSIRTGNAVAPPQYEIRDGLPRMVSKNN